MDDLKGRRVTVVGLGRFGGGIAVSRWLVEHGAKVLVTDQAKPEALAESCRQLDGLLLDYRLGEHREEDFTSAELIVVSPAVPPANKFLQAARRAGVPITTEIRLFLERCPGVIYGVTGTKGKSTTATLLGEMLRRRHTVWVGGNMGRSLLFDLPQIRAGHLVVLELSSFMLEYLAETQWSPHVAVVTMLADDHIDRHGSLAGYLDAKKNIVRYQGQDDWVILSEEFEYHSQFVGLGQGKVRLYGLAKARQFALKLPGQHNQINAQAAFAAASVAGIEWDEAQDAIRDFPGLPHRLQLVHEAGGVRYYNDSIATIPQAAVAALDSFPARTVIQIVGGYDKKLPLTAMCGALVQRAKAVLCIGKTGGTIAQTMREASIVGGASVYECGDLATAMRMTRQIATCGDVVLLSPGCASYGEFINFEHRGEEFSRMAREAAAPT